MTTPSLTTSANGELLVAFISYDGPTSGGQTATVTGGALRWTLRSRSNHQLGTAEIWSAVAPTAPFTTTVTSRPGNSGSWHGSLTVVGFLNASGVGRSGQTSAPSGFKVVGIEWSVIANLVRSICQIPGRVAIKAMAAIRVIGLLSLVRGLKEYIGVAGIVSHYEETLTSATGICSDQICKIYAGDC